MLQSVNLDRSSLKIVNYALFLHSDRTAVIHLKSFPTAWMERSEARIDTWVIYFLSVLDGLYQKWHFPTWNYICNIIPVINNIPLFYKLHYTISQDFLETFSTSTAEVLRFSPSVLASTLFPAFILLFVFPCLGTVLFYRRWSAVFLNMSHGSLRFAIIPVRKRLKCSCRELPQTHFDVAAWKVLELEKILLSSWQMGCILKDGIRHHLILIFWFSQRYVWQ